MRKLFRKIGRLVRPPVYRTEPAMTGDPAIGALIALDLAYYRRAHPDLGALDDDALLQHYCSSGYLEGRQSADAATRDAIPALVAGRKTLEIGPFCTPLVRGPTIVYADVLSTEELVERSRTLGRRVRSVPEITHVLRDGSLRGIDERFAAAVSCHTIEHQPDLIGHLLEVAALLDEGGSYYMVIPNAKFCFDRSLPETKISDIIEAHRSARRVHRLASVIEHRALVTHNNHEQHWQERRAHAFERINPDLVRAAIDEFDTAAGHYIDVHAWQFTPFSFANIVDCLIRLDMIPFRGFSVHGPVAGRNEFTAFLHR